MRKVHRIFKVIILTKNC